MPPKEIDAVCHSRSKIRSTTALSMLQTAALSMLQTAALSIPPGGKSAFVPAAWCSTELVATAKDPKIASTLGVKKVSVNASTNEISIERLAA